MTKTEFQREERYVVFKVSDLGNSLKGDEIRRLAREYAEQRRLKGKEPLECVVVEKDWPEYEPTWEAIEARVTGAQPAPSFADAYQGAMEEVAIWKKRALEAEDLNRKFVAEINGPTYMGGPAHSKPDCGEAGHDEGRCGNKQCLPGAQLAPSVPEDAPQGAQNVASSQDAWKTLAKDLLREIERQTCTHEETHRGGFVWEICDSCGAKWADDEGGKPEFKWPKVVERAHAMLAKAPEAKP